MIPVGDRQPGFLCRAEIFSVDCQGTLLAPPEVPSAPEDTKMPHPIVTAIAVAAGYLAYKKLGRAHGAGALSTPTEIIDVDVHISTAYNQWTQVEELHKVMQNVL